MQVGLRVVRGPDWKYKKQDGGEGNVGTVTAVGTPDTVVLRDKTVTVLWDSGTQHIYRVGLEDSYDLRVFDSAPMGVFHASVRCDECRKMKVSGMRWKCFQCEDFDLCTRCYMSDKHDVSHRFRRYDIYESVGVIVPKRKDSIAEQAKGLFPGAVVKRGKDWKWQGQDGNGRGTVEQIENWKSDAERDAVSVKWADDNSNMYRAGYQGQVDVKYVVAGDGGKYYRSHLPCLCEEVFTRRCPQIRFKAGDRVEIYNRREIVSGLLDGHGGWTENLEGYLGQTGEIYEVDDDSDVHLKFNDGSRWVFNSLCFSKVSCPTITNSSLKDGSESSTVDLSTLPVWRHLTSELENVNDLPGFSSIDWIVKHSMILKNRGETLMHMASRVGRMELLHLLIIITGKDMEMRDDQGNTPLHCAAENEELVALNYLLKQGANADAVNSNGFTALHISAKRKCAGATRILIDNGCNVNMQDHCGYTALHCAIDECDLDTCDLLIEALGIDFFVQNINGLNVLHHAASIGNDVITEKLITKCRRLIDRQKNDGNTALHIAAANGHLKVAEVLLWKGYAAFDISNKNMQTPLLVAVDRCHCDLVELLVSFNANIHAADQSGNTALHIALLRQDIEDERHVIEGSEIAVILSSLARSNMGKNYGLAIACYLVKHGASISRANKQNKMPLELTSNELTQECLLRFCEVHGDEPFLENVTTYSDCMICTETISQVLFDPCGHVVTCEKCCIRMKKCIVCQEVIVKKTINGQVVTSEEHDTSAEFSNLKSEFEELREDQICKICMENRWNMAFLCGHTICASCAEGLSVCHMCRKPVTQKINIY